MIISPKILCLPFSLAGSQTMASTLPPSVLLYLPTPKPGQEHLHLISSILQLTIRPRKSSRQPPHPNAHFLWTIPTLMADDLQSSLATSLLSREQQAGVVLISKNAINQLKICLDMKANSWLMPLPRSIYPVMFSFCSA